MFFTLLLVTFVLSIAVIYGVARTFDKPVMEIFNRIIQDPISSVWQKYIKFAAYVVGISGGVRIYQLERYISALHVNLKILVLTPQRWTLKVYRTIMMYLVVFIFALIAFVIVKGFELKAQKEQ